MKFRIKLSAVASALSLNKLGVIIYNGGITIETKEAMHDLGRYIRNDGETKKLKIKILNIKNLTSSDYSYNDTCL